jgi:hypothetical protein
VTRPRLRIPEPYRALAKLARGAGWVITRTGSGHLRWQPPAGGFVITSYTPDGKTTVIKDRARLRKAGLDERKAP